MKVTVCGTTGVGPGRLRDSVPPALPTVTPLIVSVPPGELTVPAAPGVGARRVTRQTTVTVEGAVAEIAIRSGVAVTSVMEAFAGKDANARPQIRTRDATMAREDFDIEAPINKPPAARTAGS